LAAITEHAHIVRYYFAWEEDDRLYIQTELCEGGSLEDLLKAGKRFSEEELLYIINQVASGLHHIHSLGLVHLDIKPENIYGKYREVNNHGLQIYKIGDLGLMNEANDDKIFMDGDCRYLSRELLEDDMSSLRKSDIFSLGATFYELSRGTPLPREGEEWREIRNGVITSNPNFSAQYWALIKSFLSPDPNERPSTEEILQHPLLVQGEAFSHPAACCPLKSALETSQREVLHLHQKLQYLENKLLSFITTKTNVDDEKMEPASTNNNNNNANMNNNQNLATELRNKMQL